MRDEFDVEIALSLSNEWRRGGNCIHILSALDAVMCLRKHLSRFARNVYQCAIVAFCHNFYCVARALHPFMLTGIIDVHCVPLDIHFPSGVLQMSKRCIGILRLHK